jgi:hypothetical protein
VNPIGISDSNDGFANFAVFSSNSTSASALGQSSRSAVQPQSTSFYANYSSFTPASTIAPPVPADKYSALADLENVFMAPTSVPSTLNWDSMKSGMAPSSSWASAGFASNTTGSSAFSGHMFQAGGAAPYNVSNGQGGGHSGKWNTFSFMYVVHSSSYTDEDATAYYIALKYF